ncbi:hypothetical protein ACP4OV_025949 [Aristida adscensionis]
MLCMQSKLARLPPPHHPISDLTSLAGCGETTMVIPELLVCPISLDLMSEPVTLRSSGQTYDRASIHRWLADGHRSCPVTMQPLLELDTASALLPNRTLKHLLHRWLLTGRPADLSHLALPALRDNLLLFLHHQQLAITDDTTTSVLVETLRIVRSLSPAGFCPLLLRLLQSQSQSHRMMEDDDAAAAAAELALDCLLGSPSTQELAGALHDALADGSFVLLLRRQLQQGSAKAKTALCRLIAAAAAAREDVCVLLGRTEELMAALAALVTTACDAVEEAALMAMASLCSSEPARATAVAAGAVDALIGYISAGCARGAAASARTCLRTLELLLSLDAGREAMQRHPDAAAVLVKMVFRVPSDRQAGGVSEHAVGSLLVACRESSRLRVDAINAGLLTQLLLLLQSQCTPAAKANATALLRAVWARHAGMLL